MQKDQNKETYLVSPLSVAVHRKGHNAVHGEGVTHIEIEDECGGGFIVLKQFNDNGDESSIRLDGDEIAPVFQAVKKLYEEYAKNECGDE